jgi:YbbR domain-containing protein
VTAVRVFPSVVKLTFDREIETTFAVAKPQTIGVPLMGKADLDYEPNAVRVRGPKRRLEELARSGNGQLTTEPVDVDGRVESFSKTVRIVPPADTWLSHIEPSEVMVKVGIVSRSATREWKNLPVLALTDTASAARYAIEPAGVNVTLEGRAEVLEKIEHAALAVFVNCTGVKGADAFDAPVVVHLPTPMDVVIKVEPPAVKVTVAAQP